MTPTWAPAGVVTIPLPEVPAAAGARQEHDGRALGDVAEGQVLAAGAQRLPLGIACAAHVDRRIGALVDDVFIAVVDDVADQRVRRTRRCNESNRAKNQAEQS